ncbi:MAG: DJ-1/PfpI family protein [Candidatus Hydrogenedentes bacterium]|nr:DJ-1/PfpI family protein [Candidatus Hydrogenedentota bacterium]
MTRVLVPLAQGCEELEAITIIDLLRRAQIEVVTAGLDDRPVKASRGTCILPDCTLEAALKGPAFDMVVLPGGMPGADHLGNDPRLVAFLKQMAAGGKFTCAICAAPKVLAEAGLLQGKKVTAYPGFLDGGQFPGVNATGAAVERDGKIVTSRGPGTAMDFALELIECLKDKATRDQVEKGLVRT